MKEKITKHINELFRDAPKTRRAVELKEEMTQNTIEKYEDLLGEGCQEEDAFRIVVDSIGDVTELFEDLKDRSLFLLPEEQRRKRAVLKAAAVGIYIFAGVVFIISMVVSEMYYALAPEGGILGLALTALVPIWLYRGRQGRHSRAFRAFCYLFYPVHMLALFLLREMLLA